MIWPPLLLRLASTASGTARLFSILLLILSVAPWASIYAAVSMHANGSTKSFMNSPEGEITLSHLLHDQNATLEDLWMALFRERTALVYKEALFLDNAANRIHHWTIVLPWGISLAFGIIIPFLLSLCSYMREDYPIDPDEDPWISRHRKERRLSRLLVACENYRKTLTKEDMDTSCDLDKTKEQAPRWKLPLPASTVDESNTTRMIEGTCAVCLAQYSVGDEVIWSSNLKCPHVYHDDCILSWLMRRRKQCPCCRQCFLVEQD